MKLFVVINCIINILNGSFLALNFDKNYESYSISVNNDIWLKSGDTLYRNNGDWVSLKINNTIKTTGNDIYGSYKDTIIQYIDKNEPQYKFESIFREYPNDPDKIIFIQNYPNGAKNTSIGDIEKTISSFPSFIITDNDNKNQVKTLGYVHFSGAYAGAGDTYGPDGQAQFGQFNTNNINDSKSINGIGSGPIPDTAPLALFDHDMNNTLIISSLTNFMVENQYIQYNSTNKQIQFGLIGNISKIDPGFSMKYILSLTRNGGGINKGMKEWGNKLLTYYNKPTEDNAHQRDYTLNYLGYSTGTQCTIYFLQKWIKIRNI